MWTHSPHTQTMAWGAGGEHIEDSVGGESLDLCFVDSRGWAKHAYDYVYSLKICPYLSQHVGITFYFLSFSELSLTGKERYDIFILPRLISKQLYPP